MKYFLTTDKNAGYFIMVKYPDSSVQEVFWFNPHRTTILEVTNKFIELLNGNSS